MHTLVLWVWSSWSEIIRSTLEILLLNKHVHVGMLLYGECNWGLESFGFGVIYVGEGEWINDSTSSLYGRICFQNKLFTSRINGGIEPHSHVNKCPCAKFELLHSEPGKPRALEKSRVHGNHQERDDPLSCK